jgi:hypothetical protein
VIGKWKPAHVVIGAPCGMLMVLVAFLTHLWVTSLVLVEHDFSQKGETQTTFFPLFLSQKDDELVAKLGGRRKLIETPPYSPSTVAGMRTEKNVALTLGVMLGTYTLLIASVAALFGVLGFNALPKAAAEDLRMGDDA